MRARRFAERYTDDERLLVTIELHDRPYYLWRTKCASAGAASGAGSTCCVDRVADPELFLRFVELDGSTEGKNPEPIEWCRRSWRSGRSSDGLLRAAICACRAPGGAGAASCCRRPLDRQAELLGTAGAPLRTRAARGAAASRSMRVGCVAALAAASAASGCCRTAAGVATGTMPVAPPATLRRTAARSA